MAVAPEASPTQRAQSDTAEQLFHEHSGWLYGYCLRVLRSPEEAEDALQTTYLNAWRSLNEGTRPRAGSAWLLHIARNVCFARLRSSRRRGKLEHPEDVATLQETVSAPERPRDDLIGLTDALVSMPETQRRAILLREWQGLSHREVARELGLTHSAVEALIFRARRSLAAALENPGKRKRSRSLGVLDLGWMLASLKGFLAGSAGVKVVAAVAVATATTATVAATDPSRVWRDEAPAAATAPARASPAAGPRDAVASSILAPEEAAHRAGTAAAPGQRRAHREATGDTAKARGKKKAANGIAKGKGQGNGKAVAPGQTKKADGKPNGANGGGGPARGRAESPGQGGSPPHSKAKAPEKQRAKSSR
ncbi:MAG: RNA polymerase sigma factor [Gaiellaceae bacterium]